MASFAQRRAASLARPPIDLRALLQGKIRDQGPRPLCLPISVSGAHEATRSRLAATSPEPLAPEPLWTQCVRSDQVTPQGTTLAAVSNALADRGQPPLGAWPYNSALGTDTERPPRTAVTTDWHKGQVIDLPLAHDGIESLLEDALAFSTPVVLVIEVTREFENADSSGEISVPPLNAPEGDYHTVLAVGAASDAATVLRRLLISNTWGDGWGAGGYGWLPLDYLIAFAGAAGVVDSASLKTGGPPSLWLRHLRSTLPHVHRLAS